MRISDWSSDVCSSDLQWPPEGARTVRWHLHPENGLDGAPAATPGATALRYDPADPTPSVGGPALDAKPYSVDNRALEARADVLCFTSAPLSVDIDVIGPLQAELYDRKSTRLNSSPSCASRMPYSA